MLATESRSAHRPAVTLDSSVPAQPYLVVEIPPEQAGAVQPPGTIAKSNSPTRLALTDRTPPASTVRTR